ncbi:MAG: DUF2075 domain-containing protein [Prolixibacteraceae bacterium]|nr:DUF2075 domain-containing protein [Prolixibacteraceae bacterium]
MIVYQSTKKGFINDVLTNNIDNIIHKAYFEKLGRHTSRNEVLSWSNSMMFMNNILVDHEIPADAGISIEFQIPLTSKRIDFIITGLNEAQEEQVIIIELKQWSSAQLTSKDAIVKTYFQHGESETAHPSYQAWSYATMLRDYNQTIQDENIRLIPCAYLHNYPPDDTISNAFYAAHLSKAPLFLKPDALKLRAFIQKFVKYGDHKDILYRIENGRIRPSKQLTDNLASMLEGNQEFIMIDDQKVVFETAIKLAQLAKADKKQVLIVEGGPGTGKSVVAINLLVELTKQGLVTKYISKNAAPRAVYAAKLKGIKTKNAIDNLFGGSGSFFDTEPNTFDALIVDEAHRLNMKSGLYQNMGENQVIEIIDASKFTIFFIDNDQRIHINDIGEKKQIDWWAKRRNAHVHHLKLASQFRCNGSDGYLAWLDNTLQIKETANILLTSEDFDFQIFDNPNELKKTIETKNSINNKSRLVAGYCWDWISKKKNTAAFDVQIPAFNFAMKWNLEKDGSTWIIEEGSISEIGCIHTCQGLEMDYVGVIIGDDMRYENGKIITDFTRRSAMDNSIKGIKKLLKEDRDEALAIADRIIKNTYRTLLTRGMKGCYVHCCDPNLAEYLKSRIQNNQQANEFPEVRLIPRVEPAVNDDVKFVDFLPLYSLKAACGKFSEWQTVDELGWVKAEGVGKLNKNMFVVQGVGHSMEPRIADGDFCVFRANVVGSRSNKVVLVQHNDHYDSENEGSYSIKKYTSMKNYDPETGEWMHEKIVLEPLNPNYASIVIEDNDGFVVVGEFIGTIHG